MSALKHNSPFVSLLLEWVFVGHGPPLWAPAGILPLPAPVVTVRRQPRGCVRGDAFSGADRLLEDVPGRTLLQRRPGRIRCGGVWLSALIAGVEEIRRSKNETKPTRRTSEN